MNESRRARLLVRLFPVAWRERYETEFFALLGETGMSLGIVYDVALAALVARLDPNPTRERWPLMTERLRRAELVIFVCWVVVVVAGAGFAKLTEDPPLERHAPRRNRAAHRL